MQQTEVIIWIKKHLEAVNVHGYTITEYLLPPIHESTATYKHTLNSF